MRAAPGPGGPAHERLAPNSGRRGQINMDPEECKPQHPETRPPFRFEGIDSVAFLKEIQEGRLREITRRIARDYYSRPDVVDETARKIMESGDL
jgi:hypothetical protein